MNKCECSKDSSNNPNPKYMYDKKEWIGMYHKPNECKCKNELKQYLRYNTKIWLCSCCVMFGDKPI
jgi:hypothetical protein